MIFRTMLRSFIYTFLIDRILLCTNHINWNILRSCNTFLSKQHLLLSCHISCKNGLVYDQVFFLIRQRFLIVWSEISILNDRFFRSFEHYLISIFDHSHTIYVLGIIGSKNLTKSLKFIVSPLTIKALGKYITAWILLFEKKSWCLY